MTRAHRDFPYIDVLQKTNSKSSKLWSFGKHSSAFEERLTLQLYTSPSAFFWPWSPPVFCLPTGRTGSEAWSPHWWSSRGRSRFQSGADECQLAEPSPQTGESSNLQRLILANLKNCRLRWLSRMRHKKLLALIFGLSVNQSETKII